MRSLIATGLVALALSGCAPGPYWSAPPVVPPGMGPTAFYSNPAVLPVANHQFVWETVVDVVDDYFRIQQEEPVRQIGQTFTRGQLVTFPEGGATILEPWRNDSASPYEIAESTLQSTRRWATVGVAPAEGGGYQVEVAVFKELEDVIRPEYSTAGAATFRYDDSLTRVVEPVAGQSVHKGWIPQGRDMALEQRILADLQARCAQMPVRMLPLVR